MHPTYALGLTGGIGSGKSTIADLFGELGACLIDTDLIAHQLSAAGGLAIPALRAQFGSAYIDASGALDRAGMRELVFANPQKKRQLEDILHPLIRQQTELAAQAATGPYIMFVVPLLVESGNWRERVDRIVVVDCPEQLQLERVMQRNGLSRAQVEAIMRQQASRTQRLAVADDVISNDGELETARRQVLALHRNYLALAGRSV